MITPGHGPRWSHLPACRWVIYRSCSCVASCRRAAFHLPTYLHLLYCRRNPVPWAWKRWCSRLRAFAQVVHPPGRRARRGRVVFLQSACQPRCGAPRYVVSSSPPPSRRRHSHPPRPLHGSQGFRLRRVPSTFEALKRTFNAALKIDRHPPGCGRWCSF